MPALVMVQPEARPSRPSVRLTALELPTMTMMKNGMANQPMSLTAAYLKNGKWSSRMKAPVAGQPGKIPAGQQAEQAEEQEFLARAQAVGFLFADLEVVVGEPDRTATEHDKQAGVDERVVNQREQQRGKRDHHQDQHPAHGRGAGFALVEFGQLVHHGGGAEWLPGLDGHEDADELRAEPDAANERGEAGERGAEGDRFEQPEHAQCSLR